MKNTCLLVLILIYLNFPTLAQSGSLDLPSSTHGLSLGNSVNFTGWRFNIFDNDVDTINGLNFTLIGNPHDPEYSAKTVNGFALGWEPTANVHNGFSLAGYQVTSNRINGVAFGAYGIETFEALQGLAIGGLYVGGHNSLIQGVALSGLWTGGADTTLEGLAIGSINITEKTNGLQIGLFNRTDELNGLQIGILNYAGNNTTGFKLMPGLNAHFSF